MPRLPSGAPDLEFSQITDTIFGAADSFAKKCPNDRRQFQISTHAAGEVMPRRIGNKAAVCPISTGRFNAVDDCGEASPHRLHAWKIWNLPPVISGTFFAKESAAAEDGVSDLGKLESGATGWKPGHARCRRSPCRQHARQTGHHERRNDAA